MRKLFKGIAAAAAVGAAATGIASLMRKPKRHASGKPTMGKKIAHDAAHAAVHLTDPHKNAKQ